MRSSVIALAAVCIVAAASLVIFRAKKAKFPVPAVPSVASKPKVIARPADTIRTAYHPVQQAAVKKIKPLSSSGCDLAFMQPKHTEMAILTGTTDTFIHFSGGTQIKADPADFINEQTGQPVAGAVKLQVKEFYNMEDILLQDLSTATKDGLLETNGMINIQAFAANGDACKLKKGGMIEIHFPQKNDKPDMELFTGVKDQSGNIIWQPLAIHASVIKSNAPVTNPLPKTEAKKRTIDTTLNTLPVFIGGLDGIAKNINSVQNPFPLKNRNALVIADFNVDAVGNIVWVERIKGGDEDYYAALQQALYKMPAWKPAMVKGRETMMTMRLTVSFSLNNIRLLKFWSCVKSPDQTNGRKKLENRYFENGAYYAYGNTNNTMLDYYAFSTSNLGWINCDRFYNSPAPKIQLYVAAPIEKNTSIKLIFHSIKSVLNATEVDGRYCFTNVPAGEAVTVVALKGDKDKLRMAVKSMNISNKMIAGLEYKSVTPDDVRSTMQQFNKLSGAVAKN